MHWSELGPADVVGYWLKVGGIDVFHVGLVGDAGPPWGPPSVISASKRTGLVLEEPWEDFSQGAPVRRLDLRGKLDPQQVLGRARSRLGQQWRLLFGNCEHFVRWAHGLPEESPQLQGGVAKAGLVLLGTSVVLAGAAAVVEALSTPEPRPRRRR